jgi:WD40 repeat protein
LDHIVTLGEEAEKTNRALMQGFAVMRGHAGPVDSVECCGAFVVTSCSADKTVRMWDQRTNKTARCFAGIEGVNHAMLTDEKMLVATCTGELLCLDARWSGQIVAPAAATVVWRAQLGKEVLNQVAVCAEQNVALVCDDDGVVHTVTLDIGSRLALEPRHTSLCTSVALRASYREAVSVGTDCVLKQWSLALGKLLTKSSTVMPEAASSSAEPQLCNPPHLLSVACDPRRGAVAAAASGDGRVLIWDCAKHKFVRTLTGGHTYSVSHVSWPTESTILSAGNDCAALIWSIDPRKPKSAPSEPVRRISLCGKPNWTASDAEAAYFAIDDVVQIHMLI